MKAGEATASRSGRICNRIPAVPCSALRGAWQASCSGQGRAASAAQRFPKGVRHGTASDRHPDPPAGRSAAGVAVQFGVGILSERRPRTGAAGARHLDARGPRLNDRGGWAIAAGEAAALHSVLMARNPARPGGGDAVAHALREMALLLEAEGANPYRARAYQRAARAIEALGDSLEVLTAEGRLTLVPGIGSALAATIEELVRTGRSAALERLRERRPPGAAGDRVERKIRAARERPAEPRPEEMLLHEATAAADDLLAAIGDLPTVDRAEAAGALRRRVESVASLEVVIAGGNAPAILEGVARLPQVASSLDRGGDRLVCRLTSGVIATALAVRRDAYGLALNRLTGSTGHLTALEARARACGLTLDDSGLRGRGRRLAVRSEEDIYRHLALPFIAPELREDGGEVEAAVAGTLPPRLVERGDIRGVVHCHTTYSDGVHSIEEMARAADALGMEYLTITDHSPTASYARGLTVDRLRRQWDEIARVQEAVRVRLLRGTESDILADGGLDYPDAVLAELDIVIASIHHRHRMDAAQMTRRIIAAMRHPCFKIWGHALGRYVLRRPPFDCDMHAILDALAESRAAVEVNGDPHRLDMEPRWIREARRRGIAFVISTDAHSAAALHNLRWGVDMARRGWLAPADVLNTRGVDEFRAAVRP